MRPNILLLGLWIAALAGSGCTQLRVTRVPSDSDLTKVDGRIGYLPKPCVQVTPQSDGSIQASIIYVPDPTHTYAIRSKSYLATDTLEVVTNGGIIQSISWTGDSSAVASQAATSAGSIAGTMLQAEQKKQADMQTQETTARKNLADAQLALAQARADNAIVQASPVSSNADKLKAEQALSDASLKYEAAEDALLRIETGHSNQSLDAHFLEQRKTNPSAKRSEVPDKTPAYGPMLFAVDEELEVDPAHKDVPKDVLRLRPITQNFGTSIGTFPGSIQPQWWVKAAQPIPGKSPNVFPTGEIVLGLDKDKTHTLQITSDVPLKCIFKPTSWIEQNHQRLALPPITRLAGALFVVSFDGWKSGKYVFHYAWQKDHPEDDAKEDGSQDVTIDLHAN